MTIYTPMIVDSGAVVVKMHDGGVPGNCKVELFKEYDEMGGAWFTDDISEAAIMDFQYAVLTARDLRAGE